MQLYVQLGKDTQCFYIKKHCGHLFLDGNSGNMAHNVSRLCEEAEFGAQNCQHSTKVDAR